MARTAPITAHVEPGTKAAFEKLAKDDGRTLSQYVERLLIAHLDAMGVSSEQTPVAKPSQRRRGAA